MSEHTTRRVSAGRPAWSSLAVVVEAIMLLVFLMGSVAVLTQLFVAAAVRGSESEQLAQAISAATSTAERFAADPQATKGTSAQNGFVVTCEVSPQATAQGTLYHATITVLAPAGGGPLYVVETACYERQVE